MQKGMRSLAVLAWLDDAVVLRRQAISGASAGSLNGTNQGIEI
jgi:hypothetical protein